MMNIAIYDPSKEDGQVLEPMVCQYMQQIKESVKIHLFQEMDVFIETMRCCRHVFDFVFMATDGSASNMQTLAKQVRNYHRFCGIIFIGPRDLPNLELLEIPAASFLKKPFVEGAVAQGLEKALSEYDPQCSRHILIHTARQEYDLLLDNFLYAVSNRRIVTVHTRQGFEFSCYCRLSDLEEQLNDPRFLRCHQSSLVNMDYINNIVGHNFIMEGGDEVKIRQSGISKIKESYFAWALGRHS